MSDWSPSEETRLEALWRSGLSSREIGHQLNKTRNAVIGKLHRLELAGPQKRHEPPHDVFNGGGCLWPQGNPGEPGFGFCGAEPQHGKPYCPQHCARAYRQSEETDDATRS